MSRPHGHVRVSSRSPRAAGVCDRCGRIFNRNSLSWAFDWRGQTLQNLRLLVCSPCLDVPQQQLRSRILGPDPLPIYNPRPEPFAPVGYNLEQTNHLVTPGGSPLVSPSGSYLTPPGNNPDFMIGP